MLKADLPAVMNLKNRYWRSSRFREAAGYWFLHCRVHLSNYTSVL